ncbi:hypothetical protein PVNG_02219 [Plasmodium vivax North Korean]|uniref:Variable surface protein n=1 Tax=Plasmodium vivax North Korean TaxID=1035514 RepID=A0A0J9TVF5_PLAVI|nr:hypothetical protein PVNG_02219 [Plasmodium vivax North Korean]
MFGKYNNNIIVHEQSLYSVCNLIRVPGVENASIYNEFCAKLMRNIKLIDDLPNEGITEVKTSLAYAPQAEESNGVSNKNLHCSYLNKWIYYYIHEKPVPDNFIQRIFEIKHKMLSANPESYKCMYESLNEDYLEPNNVIKLFFIADYTETILHILRNNEHQYYSACLKYIRECVNTYKKMNKENCTPIKPEDNKCVTTCEVLKIFKNTYESEIYKLLPQQDEVLNLKSEKMDPGVALQLNGDGHSVESSEQLSGTLRRNITTGAAAAAGTGALLLALNKVNINSMYKKK